MSAAKQSPRALACERYTRFLLQSYLKWTSNADLCNSSCLVRFHQATLVDGRAYYPSEFLDLIRLQLLVDLEVHYGATASGWAPNVEACLTPDNAALKLDIWFEQIPQVR